MQICVPKRKEVPVIPTSKSNPLPYITIASMEVPIIDKEGPIVIKDPVPSTHQDESASGARVAGKEKRAERDPKYIQPKWCPRGMSKMQRCKLQRAWHKKQKKGKVGEDKGGYFQCNSSNFSSDEQNRRCNLLHKSRLGRHRGVIQADFDPCYADQPSQFRPARPTLPPSSDLAG